MAHQVEKVTRDTVFTSAGLPSVTYVDRAHLQIEKTLRDAVQLPNQIVSVAGPSKIGKTVLCKKILAANQYVWLEGGQLDNAEDIWKQIVFELNYPNTVAKKKSSETKASVGGTFFVSAQGSHLRAWESEETYEINEKKTALRHLMEHQIILVIDDFHYMSRDDQRAFLRSIKGPVFNGLKVILLSVTHRGKDAVKSERELQGRVKSVIVPDWEIPDLREIGQKVSTL